MEMVAAVILGALIEYMVFSGLVGRAREKYGIQAPATVGHPDFERVYRVQMNTLENLIVFVPSVWIFGLYLSAPWAAVLGVAFIAARIVYAVGYIKAAEKRGLGAGLSGLVTIALVVGGAIGIVRALL
jgi:glutathione S-transferase